MQPLAALLRSVLALLLLGWLPGLHAASPEARGLEIATETKQRDAGWGDMQAKLKMILRNQHGQESLRELRIKSLEVANDGDKSLTIFDLPLDVKGTAFLSYSHPLGADDQWLYLPALKRVKRIASRNKSGPFMGSEFAYEDLTSFEIAKYTYSYVGEETVNGQACYKVEQFPVDRDSGYTRRVVWVDKEAYRLQKVEFYDRKDSLLKTLTFEGYNRYLDRHWGADRFIMVNHQTGKGTVLEWSDYRFQTGLGDNDFNRNSLKRGR